MFVFMRSRLISCRTPSGGLFQASGGMGDPGGGVRCSEQEQVSIAECSCSITLSPVSVAALGLVSESRGLSLRFPRFIRVRDDKGQAIEQASSPEFLAN